MSLFRALTASSGGGGKLYKGTITLNSSTSVSVNDMPSKPKWIWCCKKSGNSAGYEWIYDEEVSTTEVKYHYSHSAGGNYDTWTQGGFDTFGATDGGLHSIDEHGFTLNKATTSNYQGTYIYVAYCG